MSLKKYALLLGLSCQISAAYAGFYAGLGIGSDTVSFKQSGHVVRPGSFDVLDKTHLSGTGVFGTLFGGYSWLVKQFYLAAEVNGNISSTVFKGSNFESVHGTASSTKYEMPHSVGVSVLPGYFLLPTSLLYVRAGYTNGEFKSKTTDISLANTSKSLDGFRYGLGLKQTITEKVALRLDYSRIDYNNVTFRTNDVLGSTRKTTIITPREQLIELGIVVSFNG